MAMNADGTKQLAVVARIAVGIKGYLAVIKAVSCAGRCKVGDIEGDAARVEYVVAVFTGGCGVTGIEGAAETGATGVAYKAIDIEASCIWLRVSTVTEGAGEVTEVVQVLAVVRSVAATVSVVVVVVSIDVIDVVIIIGAAASNKGKGTSAR
jgi:hypothetical protein